MWQITVYCKISNLGHSSERHMHLTAILLPSSIDPNEMFQDGEESKDGEARTRTNTLLSEQATETTSIFSSSDKRTNVLETDDTNEMIITVGHLSATVEENGNLEFPLQTTPEAERKTAPEGVPQSPLDKIDNNESVSPSA